MSLYAQAVVRLLRDPELRIVNETNVVSFGAGISEGKNKKGEYINNAIEAEAWGKTADVIDGNFKKGDSFQASGNIIMQEWEDKQTGQKRRKHVFKVNRMEFLPRANSARAWETNSFDEEEI